MEGYMERLYTAQEAAELLGMSYDYFRRTIKADTDCLKSGDPATPQSWRYRFTIAQIEKIRAEKWQPQVTK